MYHKSTFIAHTIIVTALFYAVFVSVSSAQNSDARGISVEITSLQEGSLVDRAEIVRGTVSPARAVNDLRMLVRPIGGQPNCFASGENWYPQREPTTRSNGNWEGVAIFGGSNPKDDGCNFKLVAATFTPEGLASIKRYFEIGETTNEWLPIPFPDNSSARLEITVQRR